MSTLNWGLLSTARINGAILDSMPTASDGRVLAVASRSMETAQAYATERGIPRAYGHYADLLADPDIHIIYNSLPNHLHAEWTMRALQAGKHVLCEKPFALSVAEVEAMFAAAHQHGRVLAEAFMYRHHPKIKHAKHLLESGTIGEPRFMRAAFSFTLERPGNYRWEPGAGGGALWDVGCYPVSLIRYLFGAPTRVHGWQARTPSGVDESFVGMMEFEAGRVAQFDCSFNAPYRVFAEVVGTAGTLELHRPFQPDAPDARLTVRRGTHGEEIQLDNPGRYWLEVEDMHRAVRTGAPPEISAAETRGVVETINALYASIQST